MRKPFIESKGEGTIHQPTQHEKISQIIQMSKLWDGDRKNTHKFILSPSVYEITTTQREELEEVGKALHETMAGFGRLAVIANNEQLAYNGIWKGLRRILNTGVPATYSKIQLLKPSRVPGICKVDFMLGTDGKFYIAEVDGHNKHGLGYSALSAMIRTSLQPKSITFPGVVKCLAKVITKRNLEKKEIILLYADRERFYLPELNILKDELEQYGIKARVVSEIQLTVKNKTLFLFDQPINPNLFIDFPFLYKNTELNTWMKDQYLVGKIDFVIPPKPFLGTKALLALIRNDEKNADLEAILKSQISERSLKILRRYIPITYLVSKSKKLDYWKNIASQNELVLKESISYGMKGTIFHDDDNFEETLVKASKSYYRYILQQEITNMPRSFQYFTNNGDILLETWYMRVTVHYSERRVADIIVTARQDKKVHGAKDCIQLGVVITKAKPIKVIPIFRC